MSKMTTAIGNAHRLTQYAMEEASRVDRRELGVEHLLLALTLDASDAGQVLRASGVTVAAVRSAVAAEEAEQLSSLGMTGAQITPGPISIGPGAGWTWTPVAEKLLTASGDGTTAGILRRVLAEPSGAIASLLRRMDVSAEELRDRLDAATALPPAVSVRRPHPLARSAAAFVAASIHDTWALISSAERLPEWEESVGHVTGDSGGGWIGSPRDEVTAKPAFRRLQIARTRNVDAHRVSWTFRYPDAPRANERRIGLRLEPAAGGTMVHIDYAWERPQRRRRAALGRVMAPVYRLVVAMQVARLGASIGAALR
ncbi:SRPBCC family protein [Microbacterium oleivorans]|uniref:Clp protease N-terminal domain-containing protein n=1 Tax=Microbacterium oleivorans TaxID=273677 RepID=UPI0010A2CA5F|nr:Clp protease N-terminal domain-containing protein [Microbacterium oleivorans]THE07618.1 SRPBCC family protein [Microbacterium oleivorans]